MNLYHVLRPVARISAIVAAATADAALKLCGWTQYDSRARVIERKIAREAGVLKMVEWE